MLTGPTPGQEPEAGCLLDLQDVTVRAPEEAAKVLVADLSIRVLPGESLLVVGPSSAGKTSLLRAIRGLWPSSGNIRSPSSSPLLDASRIVNSSLFLPQKAFLSNGSLRDQLLYPSVVCRQDQLQEVLCS